MLLAAADHRYDRVAAVLPIARLGPYRLLELIGSGAMGDVYKAEHVLLRRTVALKVLRPELARDREFAERFLAEARAVNLVGHENIVQITDFVREDDGSAWFVMELLQGRDLAVLRREQRLSLERCLRIVRQITEALIAVHDAGVVHRDIKPENVFIVEREGKDFVKLLDFGIARLPSDACEGLDGSTQWGRILGTPPYLAPEQACAGRVDHRSDIYGVGALLFELISGRRVFEHHHVDDLLSAVAYMTPPRVSHCADVPAHVRGELDRLIASCLRKNPAQRPQSARELLASLTTLQFRLREGAEQNAVQEAAQACPPQVAHAARASRGGIACRVCTGSSHDGAAQRAPARLPVRRRPLLWAATAAVMAGLYLASGGFGAAPSAWLALEQAMTTAGAEQDPSSATSAIGSPAASAGVAGARTDAVAQ